MTSTPPEHATKTRLVPGVNPRVIYGSASGRPIYEGFQGDSRTFSTNTPKGTPDGMIALNRTQLVAAKPIPAALIPGYTKGDRRQTRVP